MAVEVFKLADVCAYWRCRRAERWDGPQPFTAVVTFGRGRPGAEPAPKTNQARPSAFQAGIFAPPAAKAGPVIRGTFYFFAGSSTGTWGDVLLTLTLPSPYWLLLIRASRTRMNFSASMAHLARNS